MRAASCLFLAALVAFGCSSASEPASAGPDVPSPFSEASSPLEREVDPQVDPTVLSAVVEGNTEFAFDLFRQSAAADANLVQAPLSLSTVLSMTYAGARGETAAELAAVLHFTEGAAQHASFNLVDRRLEARVAGATGKDGAEARLQSDNMLFSRPDIRFEQPFLDTLALNYGAGVQLSDLASQQALDALNGYVAERTEQRVPELLSKFPPDCALILINTVYVNAGWAIPFDKGRTASAPFAAPGGAKPVPFMHAEDTYLYADTELATAVEIPTTVAGLALDIGLPKGDLGTFEQALHASQWATLTAALQPRGVALSLPKVKVEPAAAGSLVASFEALGLKAPLTGAADFSGITASTRLQIADIVHKTFFEIDEDGLEAAASSAVVMTDESATITDVTFTADRPFVFVLRDTESGSVLFVGHIVDPT